MSLMKHLTSKLRIKHAPAVESFDLSDNHRAFIVSGVDSVDEALALPELPRVNDAGYMGDCAKRLVHLDAQHLSPGVVHVWATYERDDRLDPHKL